MLDSVIVFSVIHIQTHKPFPYTLCFHRVDCPGDFSEAFSPTLPPHPITANTPMKASLSDIKVALLWNQLHAYLFYRNATLQL
jgi:hypothetical protein